MPSGKRRCSKNVQTLPPRAWPHRSREALLTGFLNLGSLSFPLMSRMFARPASKWAKYRDGGPFLCCLSPSSLFSLFAGIWSLMLLQPSSFSTGIFAFSPQNPEFSSNLGTQRLEYGCGRSSRPKIPSGAAKEGGISSTTPPAWGRMGLLGPKLWPPPRFPLPPQDWTTFGF